MTRAEGRTLVIGDGADAHDTVGRLGSADRWPAMSGVYDAVVSVGGLAAIADLGGALETLRAHLGPASVLHFCEPTVTTDRITSVGPHDITTTLWRSGYTVFECRRHTQRRALRRQEYCWGQARLTPESAPPRRWAGDS